MTHPAPESERIPIAKVGNTYEHKQTLLLYAFWGKTSQTDIDFLLRSSLLLRLCKSSIVFYNELLAAKLALDIETLERLIG